MPRFILIDDQPDEFPITEKTCWYWDTERSLPEGESFVGKPFIARQCYRDRDPNSFVRHTNMALLFTDQAEYYAVCQKCRMIYGDMQWSGSTRNPTWRTDSSKYLEEHERTKGWCEFCDPIFGNGGWLR